MRKDLTDITVIMDRSGSMESCRSDAEGGLNHFIGKQKNLPGTALFTLVQFDNEYEFVHRAVPISNVPRCELIPRGSTALLDAVGRTVIETGQRLAAMPEAERPGLVVIAIVTDGLENASREFTREKVKQLIVHQQNIYSWQFTYLGANQDAFTAAGGMGIAGAVANYDAGLTVMAYSAAASNVGRMRAAVIMNKCVTNEYTDEEKAAMKEDEQPVPTSSASESGQARQGLPRLRRFAKRLLSIED